MPSFINPGGVSYTRPVSFGLSEAGGQNSAGGRYGRVVDVILDSTHPRYNSLGRSQALYGVFFQPLFARASEDVPDAYNLRFAYCKQNALRQIPVRNEIVQLEDGPALASSQEEDDENMYSTKLYWTAIVPIWNHPHLNIYPDVVNYDSGNEETSNLGKDFQENGDIKPLQLSAGDVVLEGRHGQSLRFGGTKASNGTSLSENSSNGKPYTILRNGQASTEGKTCVESIDEDDASLYLVSDHRVPLTEANHKFAAAVKAPKLVKDYKGKQAVLNADQVVFNARKDNLQLAAKEHASINAKTVSLDGENYLGLDADKVYLGSYAQKEANPVLKGSEAVTLSKELWNTLINFLSSIAKAPASPPAVWTGNAVAQAEVAATALKSFLARIESIKSKKVFTE